MLLEINHLTFSAGHFQNEIICFGLLILKSSYTCIHFGEMFLDNRHIFAVTNDLK